MTVPASNPAGQAPEKPYLDPIPGIINHGSINPLAGASGVGKTCFLAWFLSQLRDGKPIFGHEVNTPPAIGYLAADRGWEGGGRYWFEKAGYADIKVYSLSDDPNFVASRLRNKLRLVNDVLATSLDRMELPPGSLVVVDPSALFLGNPNDYHATAVTMLEIRRVLRIRQLTMIGTAHTSKQKADKKERYMRLQDRINGSGAQLGYGDTQMYLAGPDETGKKHYTFLWHPHTAPAQEYQLGRNAEGLFVPWATSIEAVNEALIYDMVPADGTEVTLAAVLIGCEGGLSRATIFRKLKELIVKGLIEKPFEGVYRRTASQVMDYPKPHPADQDPDHDPHTVH